MEKEGVALKHRYLEAGKIVNTHGIAGEVKILPWADDPAFLLDFDTLYIDGQPVSLLGAGSIKTVCWPSWLGSMTSMKP